MRTKVSTLEIVSHRNFYVVENMTLTKNSVEIRLGHAPTQELGRIVRSRDQEAQEHFAGRISSFALR